ncbi:MFS transporter [Kitasatospora sp. NPDC018058]|uniref:MFS transporter n=1 Tax=Kitasatospora sp. NPDC018058 TaxID=3364025 RepID=UPI0037C0FA2E
MTQRVRAVVAIPFAKPLLALSLLGRLHLSGLPVALSFLVVEWTGSYAEVGVITGALAVGQAIAGPVRGKVADRSSASRLLVVTGLGFGLGLVALIALSAVLPPRAWPLIAALATLTGLLLPPVSQLSRATWPRIAEGSRLESLYALEATGQDIVAMGGPLLASVVVSVAGPEAAVGLSALLAVLGALGFALAVRHAGLSSAPARATAESGRERTLLADPVLARALLVAFLIMASLFSVNLSLVAWGRAAGRPELAGALIAVWTLGSAVGGFVVAGRGGRPRFGLRLAGLAAGTAAVALLLPPVLDSTPWWLVALVLLIGGTAISPTLAVSNSRVGALSPEHRRAEAFGWLATATTGGAAVMLPVAGGLLDLAGPASAVGVGAVFAALAGLLGATLPTTRPTARPGRDGAAAPVPSEA